MWKSAHIHRIRFAGQEEAAAAPIGLTGLRALDDSLGKPRLGGLKGAVVGEAMPEGGRPGAREKGLSGKMCGVTRFIDWGKDG